MSRYIDVDALIDAHYEYLNEHSYNANAVFPTWSLSLMKNAPSIDIVHCGECKRRKYTSDKNKALYCDRYKKWMTADDFCSRGEKE